MELLDTERLIYLLRGDDFEARVAAARQLAERAGEPAAQAAIYEATYQSDARVRAIAAAALRQMPDAALDDRVLTRLADLLTDRRVEVRRAAAEALRDRGDPRATLPLMAALQDGNRWVALAAVEGLAAFGTPAARPALRKLSGSKDMGLRLAAAKALAEMEARP